ncbi:hypothetical protein KP509_14G081200 [Ceratopteris richardii]|uniref:Uncharacterized protein n=1 Tax=Ceratopteris richardii TaxID=49495 RepID=A0A8T2TGT3_CERRI|nr:hypothetical protein KP509_14G081200 [Ceratopteris richardii]
MSCAYKDCSTLCKESCHDQASTSSTPFVSAPSSPRQSLSSSLFIEGAGPLTSSPSEFDFPMQVFGAASAWLSPESERTAAMSTADELFYKGKIKPLDGRFMDFSGESNAVKGCYGRSILSELHTYDPSCPECAACKSGSLNQLSAHHLASPAQPSPWHREAIMADGESPYVRRRREPPLRSNGEGDGRYAYVIPQRSVKLSSLPLASHSRNEAVSSHRHAHRRARSLSPLRMFNVDETFRPRVSFESKLASCPVVPSKEPSVSSKQVKRRGRKSWTLRELLNLGDNKVHDRRQHAGDKSARQAAFNSAKPKGRGCAGGWQKGEDRATDNVQGLARSKTAHPPCPSEGQTATAASPRNVQKADAQSHEDQQQRPAHEEAASSGHSMLPSYRRSILGCLGFASKLDSVKSLRQSHVNTG